MSMVCPGYRIGSLTSSVGAKQVETEADVVIQEMKRISVTMHLAYVVNYVNSSKS